MKTLYDKNLLSLPIESALGLMIESPLPGAKYSQVRLKHPDLDLPPGFCFATDGEERVRKGDEEIIAIPREKFGENEPFLTEEQIDLIFRAS